MGGDIKHLLSSNHLMVGFFLTWLVFSIIFFWPFNFQFTIPVFAISFIFLDYINWWDKSKGSLVFFYEEFASAPNIEIIILTRKDILHQTWVFGIHIKPFLWNLFPMDFADVAISTFHAKPSYTNMPLNTFEVPVKIQLFCQRGQNNEDFGIFTSFKAPKDCG